MSLPPFKKLNDEKEYTGLSRNTINRKTSFQGKEICRPEKTARKKSTGKSIMALIKSTLFCNFLPDSFQLTSFRQLPLSLPQKTPFGGKSGQSWAGNYPERLSHEKGAHSAEGQFESAAGSRRRFIRTAPARSGLHTTAWRLAVR